jgi:poly(3-hydroxyalkanoate) synthetase
LIEGPTLASQPEVQIKMLRLQQLAQKRGQDSAAYHAVVLKAWEQAVERFMKEMVQRESKRAESFRELIDRWINDRPDHPGEGAKQWLKDLYQQNQLVEGKFRIGGRTVELAYITMPVLNVFAKDDHIIPPRCSQALGGYVGTQDYAEIALPGGHVGVFVSGKSQGVLGSGIVEWLKPRS